MALIQACCLSGGGQSQGPGCSITPVDAAVGTVDHANRCAAEYGGVSG